jgi:PAS domain S-box-containing protein
MIKKILMLNDTRKQNQRALNESQEIPEIHSNQPLPKAQRRGPAFLRYGLALGLFALTLGVSILLSYFGLKINLTILVVFALFVAAWYGGRGPGLLLALLLAAATIILNPIPPEASIAKVIFGYFSLFSLLIFLVLLVSGRKGVAKHNDRLRHQNELLLNSVGEGIIGFDTDGKCTFINLAAAGMLGWKVEELIGKQQHFIFHYAKPDGNPDPLEKCPVYGALKDGSVHHLKDEVFRRKDGTGFPVEFTSTPVQENGQLIGAVVVFRDITEQKQAKNVLRRQALLIEQSYEAIFVWDFESGIFEWNTGCERLYGFTKKEALGQMGYELLQTTFPCPLPEFISELEGKGFWTGEVRQRTKHGGEVLSESRFQILELDGHRIVLQTNRDVTERKRAEDALVQLNETLEQRVAERTIQLKAAARRESMMIKNALDVICTIDKEGRFTSLSPASFKLWGYKPDELIGRRYIELVVPEDIAKTNEAALAVMSGMITTGFENRYQHKDGSLVNMLWAAYWSDTEQLMFCVARDITERKLMEEELKRREAQLMEAQSIAHVGSWEWDIEKDKIRWSDELYRIFGLKPQELDLTFESYLNCIHPDDREMVSSIVRASLRTFEFPFHDHRIVRPDSLTRICYAVGRVILNDHGNPVKIIGITQDITERKLAEDEIKQLNENLEKQAAWLEAANKELEAFSYSVSHDLRAPLRAIDGFSRIILEDYADKLDDEGRRFLDVIRNNAQNMGHLIDDLLTFSRLGRKQLEPAEIDMNELARDVSVQIESGSNSNPQNIKIEPLPSAPGDKALIRQVFVNLLTNAVKYSTTSGSATIRIGGRSENGENIYFVQDNGVGFDMKYSNKLFGVFQRLHSAEEFEGTGVGLAIVQRIIHRHGGRVWAEGEVGKGATFYFSLRQKNLNQGELNNGSE